MTFSMKSTIAVASVLFASIGIQGCGSPTTTPPPSTDDASTPSTGGLKAWKVEFSEVAPFGYNKLFDGVTTALTYETNGDVSANFAGADLAADATVTTPAFPPTSAFTLTFYKTAAEATGATTGNPIVTLTFDDASTGTGTPPIVRTIKAAPKPLVTAVVDAAAAEKNLAGSFAVLAVTLNPVGGAQQIMIKRIQKVAGTQPTAALL